MANVCRNTSKDNLNANGVHGFHNALRQRANNGAVTGNITECKFRLHYR
jgi:hypothetical protein